MSLSQKVELLTTLAKTLNLHHEVLVLKILKSKSSSMELLSTQKNPHLIEKNKITDNMQHDFYTKIHHVEQTIHNLIQKEVSTEFADAFKEQMERCSEIDNAPSFKLQLAHLTEQLNEVRSKSNPKLIQ